LIAFPDFFNQNNTFWGRGENYIYCIYIVATDLS
jgi:hypothetical protein